MTEDRIAQNIKYFNKPDGQEYGSDMFILGETQSTMLGGYATASQASEFGSSSVKKHPLSAHHSSAAKRDLNKFSSAFDITSAPRSNNIKFDSIGNPPSSFGYGNSILSSKR